MLHDLADISVKLKTLTNCIFVIVSEKWMILDDVLRMSTPMHVEFVDAYINHVLFIVFS